MQTLSQTTTQFPRTVKRMRPWFQQILSSIPAGHDNPSTALSAFPVPIQREPNHSNSAVGDVQCHYSGLEEPVRGSLDPGATSMNASSSRSHAVFTLDIRLSYSGQAAQIRRPSSDLPQIRRDE